MAATQLAEYDPSSPTQQSFLHAVAAGETSGASDAPTEGVGGTDLSSAPTDSFGFPNWSGKGQSHAAGTYQFQPGTWDPIAQQHGLNFKNPADQSAGAWYLAQQTYASKTGGSLQDDLQAGNYTKIEGVLGPTWPSLLGKTDLAARLGGGQPAQPGAQPGATGAPAVMASMGGAPNSMDNISQQLHAAYWQSVQQQQSDPENKRLQQDVEEKRRKLEESDDHMADQMEKEGVDYQNQLKPWDEAAESKKYFQDPMERFGSLGVTFALLAAGFTHGPAMNGLAAATGMMNAMNQNDLDGYNRAYSAWKDNMDLLEKRHRAMVEAVKDVSELRQHSAEAAAGRQAAYNAQFDDQQKKYLDEIGAIDKSEKLNMDRDTAAAKLLDARAKYEKAADQQALYIDALNDAQIQNGAQWQQQPDGTRKLVGGTPITSDQRYQAYQKAYTTSTASAGALVDMSSLPANATPEQKRKLVADLDPQAAMYANYDMRAPVGLGARGNSARMQQLWSNIHIINPDFHEQNYDASRSAYVFWRGGGKGGAALQSFDAATSHLQLMEELARNLHNSGTPAFNALALAVATQTGSPIATNLDAMKPIVTTEVNKAISGTGGAGAVYDREGLAKAINDAGSPEQLIGSIRLFRNMMSAQLEAAQRRYERETFRNDFSSLVGPVAQKGLTWKPIPNSPDPKKAGIPEGTIINDQYGVPAQMVEGGKWVQPW